MWSIVLCLLHIVVVVVFVFVTLYWRTQWKLMMLPKSWDLQKTGEFCLQQQFKTVYMIWIRKLLYYSNRNPLLNCFFSITFISTCSMRGDVWLVSPLVAKSGVTIYTCVELNRNIKQSKSLSFPYNPESDEFRLMKQMLSWQWVMTV